MYIYICTYIYTLTIFTLEYIYSSIWDSHWSIHIVVYNEPFGFDDLVYRLLDLKIDINTYEHNGYWLDIGRPEDYAKANVDVDNIA